MALVFHNSLTRSLEEFQPIQPGKVSLYTCGPTVYGYAHLGNFRAFLFNDLLSRYLRYRGYEVRHVMNLTDVDDKTIRSSQAEGRSLSEFTNFYIEELLKDFDALRIRRPEVLPRATDSINEMVEIIKILLEKDFAYRAPNGDIYFRVSKFANYGALPNIDLSSLKVNADGRLKQDEYTKDELSDFALWKAYVPTDGNCYWETEVGKGRPGWHIECSAMARRYLGQPIDIHCGGIDLLFPHHTNEVAQSEAAYGVKFVNYWLHNEHLLVDGKKMAKSAGNFFTVHDLIGEMNVSPRLIRYELLRVHYRQQPDFRLSHFAQADAVLRKFDDFVAMLKSPGSSAAGTDVHPIIVGAREAFIRGMDDDLNVSKAFAAIHEFMSTVNGKREELSSQNKAELLEFLDEFDSVFGFINWTEEREFTAEENALIQAREAARSGKNWAESDRLRTVLNGLQIAIEDRKEGSTYRKRG